MDRAEQVSDPMSMPERLRVSAERIEGLRAQLKTELERRNHLAVSMCDDGYPQHKVAEWARLSRSSLIRILATPIGLFPAAEASPQARRPA